MNKNSNCGGDCIFERKLVYEIYRIVSKKQKAQKNIRSGVGREIVYVSNLHLDDHGGTGVLSHTFSLCRCPDLWSFCHDSSREAFQHRDIKLKISS